MPLLDDATAVLSRLGKASSAKADLAEATMLNELKTTLATKQALLGSLLIRSSLFVANGVRIDAIDGFETHKKRIEKIAEKFEKSPCSKTLKTGQSWPNLVEALDVLAQKVSVAQKAAWQNYATTTFFTGSKPADLKQRLAPTPNNNAVLPRYTLLFGLLSKIESNSPGSQEEFEQAINCSNELGSLFSKFEQDVPPDVAAFLTSSALGSGASLDLLTPVVTQWLQDNDLTKHYVVRASSSN
jgi:hypothetical protein